MRIRVNIFAALLLVLALAACNNKPSNTTESQSASTTNQQSAPTDQQQATANATAPGASTQSAEAPPPPPKPVVLPAGTTLAVKVAQAISTKTAKDGDTFVATTASPISVDGKNVVPAGSRVQGVVVQSKSPGKFKGEGTLSVKLTALTIKGISYPINTAPNTSTEKGKGKRSAAMVGGGGAGGALIGGLAGGGKGAAVGAVVGVGAGAAGAGLTGNKDLEIPAESALTFQLQQALTLKPDNGTTTVETANKK